jgi:hypothetical protein
LISNSFFSSSVSPDFSSSIRVEQNEGTAVPRDFQKLRIRNKRKGGRPHDGVLEMFIRLINKLLHLGFPHRRFALKAGTGKPGREVLDWPKVNGFTR